MQALLNPQILNVPCCLFDPGKRMGMGKMCRAGDIQYPRNLPVGHLQRHGGTIKPLVAGQEVLITLDFTTVVYRQRRTNGVGATGQLAPVGTGEQMDILGGAPGGPGSAA